MGEVEGGGGWTKTRKSPEIELVFYKDFRTIYGCKS